MRNRRSLVVACLVLSIVGVGVGSAKPPNKTLGEFVQGSTSFGFDDFEFCASGDLYTVPEDKRLRIDWISVEIATAPAGGDPVEVDIKTWLNDAQVSHALVRLDGAVNVGESLFFTQRYSSPVAIYNQGDKTIEIFACRDTGADDLTQVIVSFHGQLFDE